MTRRIVAAIVLATWATLIIGGAAAYWVVRGVMLAELDDSIVARAATLTELGRHGGTARPAEYLRDRYLIEDGRGQTIARAGVDVSLLKQPQVVSRAFATLGDGSRVRTLTLKAELTGEGAPAAAGPAGSTANIVYSAPADAFDRALTRLAWALGVSGIAAGVAAALVAIVVARRALRPLREAASVVGSIDESSLDRRVEVDPLPPELQPTAATLNQMLATLEDAFERRRRFLADASHELRTPVAALAMTLEVALRRPRSEAELRQTAEQCLRDVNMLRALVERLLDQVKSENYSDAGAVETVSLAACVEKALAVVAPLARERGITLHADAPAADRRFETQPHRLHSILVNLISNAVSHHDKPGDGNVWVSTASAGDEAVVTVRDDGPGIAPEQQPHVFEPFYRGSQSRHPEGGHLGLGLFLVQSHARALGGRCEMESTPGHGTTFRVTVPGTSAAKIPARAGPELAGAAVA